MRGKKALFFVLFVCVCIGLTFFKNMKTFQETKKTIVGYNKEKNIFWEIKKRFRSIKTMRDLDHET